MKKQGLLLILLIPFVVFGQNFVKTWEKCYGGIDTDKVRSIIPHKDGYLFFGTTLSHDGDVSNNPYEEGAAWLVNIDSKGNKIFDTCYVGNGTHANGIKILNNGSEGFYFLGDTSPNDVSISNGYWLAKADSNFNIIWQDVYGGSGQEMPRGGCLSHSGGVMEVGISSSTDGDKEVSYGFHDDWAVNLNPDGTKNWIKTYGNIRPNEGGGIIQTSDGGYMLTASGDNDLPGNIYCDGHDGLLWEAWAIKLNNEGEIEWNLCYGGTHQDAFRDVIEIEDGFLFIGSSTSEDGDLSGHYGTPDESTDIWLLKSDFYGNVIWSKNYGGTDWDSGSKMFENEDGGFTVFSATKSHDYDVQGNDNVSNSYIVWMFKINEDGDLIYQKPFPEMIYTQTPDFIKVSEYKYIAAVTKWFFGCYHTQGQWNEDIYIFEIQDMDEFIPSQAQGNSSVCLSIGTETYYSTELVVDTMETQWLLLPEEAGEITEMHDSVLITWNPEFQDTAWLQVRAVNEYGESAYAAPNEIIVYSPLIIADIIGPDSLCSASNTQTIFTTTLEDESQEINWYLQPESSGTILNQKDTVIITWSPSFEGEVSLKTGILNKCDMEEYSSSKEVVVRTCLGVSQAQTKTLKLYPNPATNQITFELPHINKQSEIQIKDIYGKVIATLIIKPNQSKLIWECGAFASGVYFYEGEISGEVYRGKVILN